MPPSYRVALASIAALTALVACKDTSAPSGTTTPPTNGPKVATLRGDIAANRTLSADTVYTLSGFVKVRAGATLTIPAGTRIVGDTLAAGSSLWITRGARIDARGSATNPIVFTSQRAAGSRAPGDWGGLVIVGNAPTSRNANDALTYGRAGTPLVPESYGGGSVPNDNSGTLQYVRIEFAGASPTGGDEQMAALTLYAVGRGTTIEYVQSLESLGSAFQWYGGTVDGRYLVSYEAGDDHFAWAEGYAGRDQFLVGYQTHQPTARSADAGLPSTTPRGIQGYGCDISNDARPGCTSYLAAPLSSPVLANFTLVGPGTGVYGATVAAQANGIMLRRGTGGTLLNGVVARWPGVGLTVREAQTDTLRQRDSLTIAGVLLTDNAAGNYDAPGSIGFGQQATFPNTISATAPTATLFTSVPSGAVPAAATLDWTPAGGSPLRANGVTSWTPRIQARTTGFFGATMTPTSYVGAADPNSATKWWQGWTAYARN
ncbi:hypothetical protein J421_3842 [Gemmatirosa kalamazoonensis]|uniref:Cell shape-determining protein MreB n=2 Tax=Gemmatirosa kalamazoonensis TaxID=861299 RepID=W0RJV8_9BACT|nr:hypothetical protein J421_3842 [Gemmatirosa kalamazoonensis]